MKIVQIDVKLGENLIHISFLMTWKGWKKLKANEWKCTYFKESKNSTMFLKFLIFWILLGFFALKNIQFFEKVYLKKKLKINDVSERRSQDFVRVLGSIEKPSAIWISFYKCATTVVSVLGFGLASVHHSIHRINWGFFQERKPFAIKKGVIFQLHQLQRTRLYNMYIQYVSIVFTYLRVVDIFLGIFSC